MNVPIYLTPNDYITQYEPNFLLLQLYYLYCRFKDVKALNVQPEAIHFKDHGRIGKCEISALCCHFSRHSLHRR